MEKGILTKHQTAGYGWKPDLPDFRDHRFSLDRRITNVVPVVVDMRHLCPPIYNQYQLGSCTANGIGGALEFDQIKQNLQVWSPSRLFIYYNERDIEGTIAQDSGASIRDGVKSVNVLGCCNASLWPYDPAKFAEKPPLAAYEAALKFRSVKYQRVIQSSLMIRAALASGIPIVFGFSVYESFEGNAIAKTGVMSMPGSSESLLGGHCVLCVGYDDTHETFICRNSWGTGWGVNGYFYMPYEYMLSPDLCSDFWIIETVI
jgi:C1A family cysteine protease